MSDAHAEVDQIIRAACAAGDFDAALTRAIGAYGSEVLGFLIARLKTRSDGEEAFSMFAEDLWRGLPEFAFRCSTRAWMYTLARNAANRYAVAPLNRAARRVGMTGRESLSALIERVRSQTQVYQRTESKERIRALRERLAIEDQTLLILRVDRNLSWRELAMVMNEQAEPLDEAALSREAARQRKRFERVKDELRELAIAEGLLER